MSALGTVRESTTVVVVVAVEVQNKTAGWQTDRCRLLRRRRLSTVPNTFIFLRTTRSEPLWELWGGTAIKGVRCVLQLRLCGYVEGVLYLVHRTLEFPLLPADERPQVPSVPKPAHSNLFSEGESVKTWLLGCGVRKEREKRLKHALGCTFYWATRSVLNLP